MAPVGLIAPYQHGYSVVCHSLSLLLHIYIISHILAKYVIKNRHGITEILLKVALNTINQPVIENNIYHKNLILIRLLHM